MAEGEFRNCQKEYQELFFIDYPRPMAFFGKGKLSGRTYVTKETI